jgi:hypothetical protein
MYQNGAKGYFDALGHHPYTIPYPPENDPTVGGGDPNWSAWYIMASSSTSLRSIMTARGDGAKKIWATEWGYPTTGGSSAVSEEQQADYLKRGLALFASYPWAGPIFVYKYHDDCSDAANRDCGHGLTRLDYSQKPAYATFATITADTVAPTVAIVSPVTGAKVRGGSTVTLQASASDAVSLSSVVFFVNGIEQCRDVTSSYSCAWTVPSKRGVQYTVEARAYDINGNQASRTVRVTSS